MQLGLRIDVDTLRGTSVGVPRLVQILGERGLRGTFFFSAGPDNMGRHLWRLLRPRFLLKMLRSNAPSLYGWDILLRGTFWPGPLIGQRLAHVWAACAAAGHEIGVHAWDHQAWQAGVHRSEQSRIHAWIGQAFQAIAGATGAEPVAAATPGWRCTDAVLLDRETFPFRFNSDCRGDSIFVPVVNGQSLREPQIPNTLPTYDELIGQNGIASENYNQHMLSLLQPERLNVLTIHAEVEGIVCSSLFESFIDEAMARGIEILPLGRLLPQANGELPRCPVKKHAIAGREGWVAVQGAALA